MENPTGLVLVVSSNQQQGELLLTDGHLLNELGRNGKRGATQGNFSSLGSEEISELADRVEAGERFTMTLADASATARELSARGSHMVRI